MPANNPIVGSRHVSSYSSAAGAPQESAQIAASPAGGAARGYNVPLAVIVLFALAILLLLRLWGFRFVVSAGTAGH